MPRTIAAYIGHSLCIATLTLMCLSCEAPQGAATTPKAQPPSATTFSDAQLAQLKQMSTQPKLPSDPTNRWADDPKVARFGQRLFFEPALSKQGDISCASCHKPEHGFSSPTPLGRGINDTARHVPGLLNIAYQRWFDWDGKADTLWGQAIRPLESDDEHGITRTQLVQRVAQDPTLRAEYEEIFGPMPPEILNVERFNPLATPAHTAPQDPRLLAWQAMSPADQAQIQRITSNLLKSIASYERQLISFNAPFDRFAAKLINGQPSDELDEAAQRGLALFLGKARCVVCHSGPLFSDFTFHNLGLHTPHWLKGKDEGRWAGVLAVKAHDMRAGGELSDDPKGPRAQWTKQLIQTPEDHGQLKTPTLRNIALTPPYMHGGHFKSLEEVVSFYNQLPGQATLGHREDSLKPLGLSDAEERDLVAFLKSLTGAPPPAELLQAPPSEKKSTDAKK